ncbi:uncharacterized protein PGTG_06285 [Puccinia graminis f. sp. tritici CRL 75-36-700-3]|uniref:Tc1-like transposase DDE domain-containing protein n=1 Tax=Puccinia graminis f. sp. tritici (strain CRL 75-36-700-3 / race SCCL) TaxID=418459 RepID=E3K7N1_PUCGT|nr:uncharacterized protein PGTG_06285 [Puccinia graminis f. sp. tritici CRL 75-36-700-3]EFP80329.2 hypothetical protein PGTG_06285 [Puccinia graminis f. sp. tritici CRL 75-36-700-3]
MKWSIATTPPTVKIVCVRMEMQNYPRDAICAALGRTISRQSFDRWMELYRLTQRVVRDPKEYEERGGQYKLTGEDREFMLELLRAEPGLFLDEIRERLYDDSGTLIGITSVHRNLVEKMSITLKKADTVNIKKSLVAKYAYIDRLAGVPAEQIVFTDESTFCSRDLLRTFSRSKKGTGAIRHQLEQNPKRFTLIPAISMFGVIALTVTKENVKRPYFTHFLKYQLLPRMNPYPGLNSILVMDNAGIHRGADVARLCHDAGVRLIYLPP